MDIRVDDSPDPFKELRRLLNITLAGRHSRTSRRLAREGKFAEALEAQKKALSMNPSDNVVYALAQLCSSRRRGKRHQDSKRSHCPKLTMEITGRPKRQFRQDQRASGIQGSDRTRVDQPAAEKPMDAAHSHELA